jgi:hypothetical protein
MPRTASTAPLGSWHDGLSSEELDQQQHIGRSHQLLREDRRAVLTLALCFGSLLILGIAIAGIAHVGRPAEPVRTSDANTPVERLVISFLARDEGAIGV